MRKLIISVAMLCCLSQVAPTQTLSKLHWTYVQIPGDSLFPTFLTFYDSLHGYVGVYEARSYSDSNYTPFAKHFYFETTDGGKSWVKITDTLFSNTYIKDSIVYVGTGMGFHRNPPVVYANLRSRYAVTLGPRHPQFYNKPVHSFDSGKTWQGKGEDIQMSDYFPLQAFDPYNLVVFDGDSGILHQTTNSGGTYSRIGDSTYLYSLYHLQLDSNYGDYGKYSSDWGTDLSFDNSDRFHWTVTVNRQYEFVTHPRNHPLSLQMLVSENFGRSWKEYLTDIPGQDTLGRTAGTLQYIKGTPNLYYFTGERGEGFREYGTRLSIGDYGDAMLGISWMYSTDYGKSWEIYRQYGETRRGFEAVKQNEVWITARPASSKHTSDPATVIARTTDNGKTWEEDTRTLTNDGIWDARIVTFSDPNHGWIAASDGTAIGGNHHTYIFRYDASEQGNNSVEGLQTELNQVYLKIYPNPALSDVHLLLPTTKPIQKVEFFNLMGRQDYPPYQLQGNIATVDVRNLPIGTYITRVSYLYKGYTGDFTLPFIVQH